MYYIVIGLVVVLLLTLIMLIIAYYGLEGTHQKNMMIASYVFIGVSVLISAYIGYDVQTLQTKLEKIKMAHDMSQTNIDILRNNPNAGNINSELSKARNKNIETMDLPPPPPPPPNSKPFIKNNGF
jgi:hypothetical protein